MSSSKPENNTDLLGDDRANKSLNEGGGGRENPLNSESNEGDSSGGGGGVDKTLQQTVEEPKTTTVQGCEQTMETVEENVSFPVEDLQRLDEMLNRTRWIVPVLPKSELECLLEASIRLCRLKVDTKSEPCQRFFRDGLTISFVRIMTDDAVNTWKYDIYKHIYNNSLKAIELCTLKLLDDWFPLLDLMAIILNPQCKYHIINSLRPCELIIKAVVASIEESNVLESGEKKAKFKIKLNSGCKKKKKQPPLVIKLNELDPNEKTALNQNQNKLIYCEPIESTSKSIESEETKQQTDEGFTDDTTITSEISPKQQHHHDKEQIHHSKTSTTTENSTSSVSPQPPTQQAQQHQRPSTTTTTTTVPTTALTTTTTTTVTNNRVVVVEENTEQEDNNSSDEEADDDSDEEENDGADVEDNNDDEADETSSSPLKSSSSKITKLVGSSGGSATTDSSVVNNNNNNVTLSKEKSSGDLDLGGPKEHSILYSSGGESDSGKNKQDDCKKSEPETCDSPTKLPKTSSPPTLTPKTTTTIPSTPNSPTTTTTSPTTPTSSQAPTTPTSSTTTITTTITPQQQQQQQTPTSTTTTTASSATTIKSSLKQPKSSSGVTSVKKTATTSVKTSKTPPSASNSSKKSPSVTGGGGGSVSSIENTAYARSYTKSPYGWLVDFINHFGECNGFALLLERFTSPQAAKLNIQVIAALLKPWGLCYQFLTQHTVRTYFLPCIEIVKRFFEQLSDEDIAKECKSENKNDSISTVIKWLKLLASRCQQQHELCKTLEILRLKTILRILKYASFNGKMNALNEVNKAISNITYNMNSSSAPSQSSSPPLSIGGPSTSLLNTPVSVASVVNNNTTNNSNNSSEDTEWLTSDRMAAWIAENDVLDIVLRDCMHQPQYVEKLEKILRFLIKEKALSVKDLDKIWESQLGKHEAIEKNVHDLLAKLAWDFSPEQLDHLFMCFQKSWASNASRKQREKLLDLIRSLSEDDKEGVMANKVLDLLWNLAHSDDAPTEIIDQAVAAHIKILDYSCSSDKESQKLKYLEKCIDQLKENKWVIVSLRQIREILQQFPEQVSGGGGSSSTFQTHRLLNTYPQSSNQSNSNMLLLNSSSTSHHHNTCFYRTDIIAKLQKEYSLISMITANLADYYDAIRNSVVGSAATSSSLLQDPENIHPDGRFSHCTQVQERLNFLKYLLKEGQLWLCANQAETIWKCLAQNSVFELDREICFKWFSKLMTDDPDLEPDMNKTFFVNYIIKLDPKLLTDSGIKCFDRFFKYVNLKYNRLVQKRNYFLTDNLDLIGLDYLWKIVTYANEDIVEKAILLLKDIYIHLGPQLKAEQSAIHADLISNCMDRLRVSYDNLSILNKQGGGSVKGRSSEEKRMDDAKAGQEVTQILRVLIVLREYLNEFDANYLCERIYPPLSRASKGKSLILIIRLNIQNRPTDDLELISHVNETIGSLRRQVYIKTKLNPQINKIDLIINNECVECMDDNKILGDYQLKEKMFIMAKITQTASGLNLNSSLSSNQNNNNNASSCNNNNNGGGGQNNSQVRLDSSAEDSSSDECASSQDNESTQHNVVGSPNLDFELQLPSLILSLNEQYVQFLIDLADFGCRIENALIKECTRGILDLLPIAKHTGEKIKQICRECAQKQQQQHHQGHGVGDEEAGEVVLEKFYANCTQTQCWYNLKVTHALLIPAVFQYNPDETKQFQENLILAGAVTCFKNLLIKENFMENADDNTKKAALLYVLKINKLTMTTVCHAIFSHVYNAIQTKQFSLINDAQHSHAVLLQNSVTSIPSSTNEITVRTLAQRLGSQFASLLCHSVPELSHIIKLERIAWSLAASGTLSLINTSQYEQIHEALVQSQSSAQKNSEHHHSSNEDTNVCRESLECLSLFLSLVPQAIEQLNQEKHWRTFIVDMVLLCPNRVVRHTASEQFLLIALKCSLQPNRPMQFFIQMLFTCLHGLGKENSSQSQEYFFLLCRLLNYACIMQVLISNTETLLNNEIAWLKRLKQSYLAQQGGGGGDETKANAPKGPKFPNEPFQVDEMLLDGHLNITKELLQFQSSDKKHMIGCHPQGYQLITDLIEYFIFPASCLFKKYRDSLLAVANAKQQNPNTTSSETLNALNNVEQMLASKSLKSICTSSMTTSSAFDLLISLCIGCLPNFNMLSDLIFNLFYPSLIGPTNGSRVNQQPAIQQPQVTFDLCGSSFVNNQLTNDCTIAQNEWEYLPPIGQRPPNGFVGLKNAGATCYMNSVLQQLFMIKAIRKFILSVDLSNTTSQNGGIGTSGDGSVKENESSTLFDDLDDTDTPQQTQVKKSDVEGGNESGIASPGVLSKAQTEEEQRKEYNITIFKHLQMIFGHLAESKMQYYVPKGFWRQFRFGGGEKVNLREQHDAVEFFNSVVDCIDESMKQLNRDQICSKVLGGTFADQKICKGCPHRYSREESFTLLSVDVKHSQRLSESLEQYVKGDLLEGPNAYHCEKCNKKIDAVKRTCIKKLPAVLAIQLKRFDYDWEREIAVKSNEYFEFPRELDMEPYTVRGVARLEKQSQREQQLKKQQMQEKLKKENKEGLGGSVEEIKQQPDGSGGGSSIGEMGGDSGISGGISGGVGGGGSSSVGEIPVLEIPDEYDDEEDEEDPKIYSTNYRLVGIVVHSGQANGGHYYSFIQNRPTSGSSSASGSGGTTNHHDSTDDHHHHQHHHNHHHHQNSTEPNDSTSQSTTTPSGGTASTTTTNTNNNNENNWFKFDDNEVSEFRMDDDEMRAQCYGGDYTGEVYDNVVKRMTYKKQKRWWNAYILFYERLKHADVVVVGTSRKQETRESREKEAAMVAEVTSEATTCNMPAYIVKSVHKKNIKFLHHRHHFSQEYFQFVKKLAQANIGICQNDVTLTDNAEELCLASVKLAFKFLFSVGFRVKKSLRGPVNDWYEIFFSYAKYSVKARNWMVYYLLIENSVILAQYFLDCPSNEIRNTFGKILVGLVHLTYNESPLELKISDLLSISNQPSLTVFVTSNNNSTTSLNSLVQTLQSSNLSASGSASLENKLYPINASDSLIQTLLSLLSKRDLINEQSSKYLIQYFQFFNYYLSLGIQQCMHLIRCDVPYVFMQFALDELPTTLSNINLNSISSSSLSSGSSSFSLNYSKLSTNMNPNNANFTSSQYADLNKLYCVISTLLRCYDVSSFCQSSSQNANIQSLCSTNPHSHINELKQQDNYNISPQSSPSLNHQLKMPTKIADMLFKRNNYLKKLLEDAASLEETHKLMKFLCYENMQFSLDLLNELLWMTAYHYSYELKPHLEILFHVLSVQDSWQPRRILCALQGIPNDREGLFDVIAKSQNHYQKRAYQIIKMLVQLFSTSEVAFDLLNKDEELKRKWKLSRNWFHNEMEKCRMYNMSNYSYYQSPQSNETSQTYFLERTQSAKITLEKAMKICPQTASSSSSNTLNLPNSNRNNSGNANNNTNNENEEQNEEPVENENEEDEIEDEDDDEEEEENYESVSDEENLETKTKPSSGNKNSQSWNKTGENISTIMDQLSINNESNSDTAK